MTMVISEGAPSPLEERQQPCIYIDLGDLNYDEAEEVDIGKTVAVTIIGKLTAKSQRTGEYGKSASLTIVPTEITAVGLTKKGAFAALADDEDA